MICYLFLCSFSTIQGQHTDSLFQEVKKTADFKQKGKLLNELCLSLTFTSPQKAYPLAQRAFDIADSLNFPAIKAESLARMGVILYRQGNPSEALERLFQSAKLFETLKDSLKMSRAAVLIGNAYLHFQSYQEAIKHYQLSVQIGKEIKDQERVCVGLKNIGRAYNRSGQPEEALVYLRQALAYCGQDTSITNAYTSLLAILGGTYLQLDKYDDAIKYSSIAFRVGEREGHLFISSDVGIQLANAYLANNQLDLAAHYAQKSIEIAQKAEAKIYLARAYQIMYRIKKKQDNNTAALYYLELHDTFQDSIFTSERLAEMNQRTANFELYKKLKENELLKNKQLLHAEELRNREQAIWAISISLFLSLLLAYFFFRGRKTNKQAKELLAKQNDQLLASEEELRNQTEELSATNERLEEAMEQLKLAQDQLINAGKMAALGQLTANVSHEINNPLGAVQSAARYIQQVILEQLPALPKLLHQLDSIHQDLFWKQFEASIAVSSLKLSTKEKRALKKKILATLDQFGIMVSRNEVDAIVNMRDSMNWDYLVPLLKHPKHEQIFKVLHGLIHLNLRNQTILQAVRQASRVMHTLKAYSATDNEKAQAVNITDSIHEALKLYKRKIKKDIQIKKVYDTDLPTIIAYKEGLHQVWSNLIINALQAMNYKGELTISIKKQVEQLQISFTDTGKGISEAVLPDIFNPFFTTKPKGEGSGLGLDIANRIITKHQGRIQVESEEGKGSTFTVFLPIRLATNFS